MSYQDAEKAKQILIDLGLIFVDCGTYIDYSLDYSLESELENENISFGYQLSWHQNEPGFNLSVYDSFFANKTEVINFSGSEESLNLFKCFIQTLMQINVWSVK